MVNVCFSMQYSLKPLECLGKLFFAIVQVKYLHFVFQLHFYIALNSLNLSKLFVLDFIAYNHTFLKNPWMRVTKYLTPRINMILMGPHMLECTISKNLVACLSTLFKNAASYYSPSMRTSQNNVVKGGRNIGWVN